MAMVRDAIGDEAELERVLSQPPPRLIDVVRRTEGDLAILGVAGKMGMSLASMARQASDSAGSKRRIFGVSRFSSPAAMDACRAARIEPIRCDLLDPQAVSSLPQAPHVVFMAGRKFGTDGAEADTWAANTVAPANVARHYAQSRIVAFSTGCVYPLVTPASGGCTEQMPPSPVGEYAQSCLGRERVFEYYSRTQNTPVCLFRLNYATDLRYGVLHDIACQIRSGQAVDLSVPAANTIWQGDACAQALMALEYCTSPASPLNVTGPETFAIRAAAIELAREMGKPVIFSGVEGERGYLSDSARATELFGYPTVSLKTLIRWTARWVQSDGRSLGKPTHFEVSTGKF